MFAAFAGLAAGLLHVLAGPDHLAAVAPLAADERRPQWRVGLQWGLGHTAGVLLIGLLLLVFRQTLAIDAISAYSERVVGLALLAIGLWGLRRARQPHAHSHTGAGVSFGMGTLHGLAGSSHFFGVLPALALPTQTAAVSYLTGFGLGAIAAMTGFAALVGVLSRRSPRRSLLTHRSFLYACSVFAFVVGGFWLVR